MQLLTSNGGCVCNTINCNVTCCAVHQVYGPNQLPPSDATIYNSMAVVASANKQWLILQLLNGPAECLFRDADSVSKCSFSKTRKRRADSGTTEDNAAAAGAAEAAAEFITPATDPQAVSGEVAATVAAAADDGIGTAAAGSGAPGRKLRL
jgi:hypothetical protein